ncbi:MULTISPECIES: universal stress protein [Rhodopseudomonas]|uniref:Universal stress protein UspA n=1 Tax=Rhodopseudomonas palustris TaxID=1076 RepID=A0A0D7EIG2_RHOPL|nr:MULTISPECIES: universal stress protein [Rhodopseudomonas]KIZ39277.1 universal stress protein UspA [Rhodopseudomonas palustris]MDF3813852.1 universal stress protein [Rhodopseudomonas sp. BAL398]WOK15443.1 universal stress protein [Rhodopseudomonas sp. BAL398]
MLSDIVVHIPADRAADGIVACAVSVAKAFNAHLDGIVCTYQPINPAIVAGASAAYYAAASQYNTDNDEAAARLNQYEIAARTAGISHGARSVCDSPVMANEALAEISRLYDLSVVPQPDRSKPGHHDPLAESVLFNSGRPMLMVPYIHTGPLKLDRVLICWDGGRPAARAVHDAMPFLHKAQTIDVVAVNEDEEEIGEASSEALIAHLLRHDLNATAHRYTAEPSNIYNSILSMAADNGTDLLVMGGYGHSRLREFILGGVTRGIFKSLTIPALISH